jgi:hypothetical protein
MMTTMSTTTVATLTGVSKTFGEGATAVTALHEVDLELAPGGTP